MSALPQPSAIVGGDGTERLVESAMARIPFYRDHLAGADHRNLAALPSFDKHQTAGYGRFPLSAGGAAGAHRVAATSGTTGDRLYLAFDRGDCDRVGRWLQTVGRQVGLGRDDVLLNTHCYGLWVGGPVLDLLAHGTGACLVPLGPGSPAGMLHLLTAGVGTAISATPSYLRRIVEAAEAAGVDLTASELRLGFIGAESAEPALRAKLLARLPPDFRWVELYGLTETFGPSVAFSPDPEVGELMLNTGGFRVEVLDLEADVPVGPGEVGELTLTSRDANGRSPLIRYRTRDLVRITGGSPSEPTHISAILGRADDALKIGGVLMYPTAVAQIITEILPPTSEWRGMVHQYEADNGMIIEIEGSPQTTQSLERALSERVGLDVTVMSVTPGSLARSMHKTQRILVESVSAETDSPKQGRSGCG